LVTGRTWPREDIAVPLTRLYRLGPTAQRVRKGYVLVGAANAVRQLLDDTSRRSPANGVVIESSSVSPRAVVLDTGWRWMHDKPARERVRSDLVEAVASLSALAAKKGCTLLPNAVRPHGEPTWQDWLVGDDHQIAMLDDVEREVATNYFRKFAPVLVAITGRAGIDGGTEPLGSRRLAESGEHLATRYLASTSARHLSLVETELRRTTGIRDLRTMDVHPLGAPNPGSDIPSFVVRCVDGQAFVSTTLAHAILMQALAMAARRLTRSGRREGNFDHRLLERRRSAAILQGIDARVDSEPPERDRKAQNPPIRKGRVSLGVLAVELLDELMFELGTLEVSFGEIAPLAAWSSLLADSALPRTETELLARMISTTGTDSAPAAAALVADPHQHAPEKVLEFSAMDAAVLGKIGTAWEAALTAPPPTERRRRPVARVTPSTRRDQRSDERPRPNSRPRDRRDPGSSSDPSRQAVTRPGGTANRASQVRRLAELPEADPADNLIAIVAAIRALSTPTSELVPWLGVQDRDLVAQARRRLRPPGNRQVNCPLPELSWGARPVQRACKLADEHHVALLRATFTPEDQQTALTAIGGLVGQAEGSRLIAINGIARFKNKDGSATVSAELIIIGERAAT
jgi:hypothetical protein